MTEARSEGCAAFVNCWFDDILMGVYEGQSRKLLANQKTLRSAYLFHVHQQLAIAKEARS
ncbi:MAG: hypothetical protein KDE56_26445 [Anaerolineales bacterium]|nr:hypothetical protein [Anaerolineales bacterium]